MPKNLWVVEYYFNHVEWRLDAIFHKRDQARSCIQQEKRMGSVLKRRIVKYVRVNPL